MKIIAKKDRENIMVFDILLRTFEIRPINKIVDKIIMNWNMVLPSSDNEKSMIETSNLIRGSKEWKMLT
jgi:hypothetical protein